jgi:hypothetical protein
MGVFGRILGSLAGNLGSALFPTYSNGKQVDGGAIGAQLGENILPFARGGVVPGQRVFNTGQMVVRKPRRTYQKSSGRKSRRKK